MVWPAALRSFLFLPACSAALGTLVSEAAVGGVWVGLGLGLLALASGVPLVRRWAMVGTWCAFGAWWMVRMDAHLQPGDGKVYRWECTVVAPPRPYGKQWDHGCLCTLSGSGAIRSPQRVRVAWPEAVAVGMRGAFVGRWEPWEVHLGFDAVRAYRPAGWGSRVVPLRREVPTGLVQVRPVSHALYRARCAIEAFWDTRHSPAVAGLLQGLSTGSTAGIAEDVQSAFAETGLVHVLSVSGYHVALLGFLPLLLLRSRHRNARKLGFCCVLPLWGYMGICGWTVPAVRACAMTTWYAIGQLCNRPVAAVQTWSVALLATVIWRPVACAQLGTQLSYLAVLGIVVAAAAVQDRGRMSRFVAVSSAATASTAPLTAPVFGVFPWAFLPVNALAGPWVSFLGLLALVCAMFPGVSALRIGVERVAQAFLDVVLYATNRWQLAWWVGDVPEVFFGWGTATGCVWMLARWMQGRQTVWVKWSMLAVWPLFLLAQTPAPPMDWVLVRSDAPAVLFRATRGQWCAVSGATDAQRAVQAWRGLPAAGRNANTPCKPCSSEEHGVHGVLTPVGGAGVAAGVPWAISRGPEGTGLFRWGSIQVPWERWGDPHAGRGP